MPVVRVVRSTPSDVLAPTRDPGPLVPGGPAAGHANLCKFAEDQPLGLEKMQC